MRTVRRARAAEGEGPEVFSGVGFEMLRRPGAPGPTPAAALQLCTLAGVEGQAAERCLAQLRLPFAAPIANRSDFGRFLFAALATQPEPVRTRLPAPRGPARLGRT